MLESKAGPRDGSVFSPHWDLEEVGSDTRVGIQELAGESEGQQVENTIFLLPESAGHVGWVF